MGTSDMFSPKPVTSGRFETSLDVPPGQLGYHFGVATPSLHTGSAVLWLRLDLIRTTERDVNSGLLGDRRVCDPPLKPHPLSHLDNLVPVCQSITSNGTDHD